MFVSYKISKKLGSLVGIFKYFFFGGGGGIIFFY